ncbi:MAG: class I SAM-dependent methyltransferase [bacterium]
MRLKRLTRRIQSIEEAYRLVHSFRCMGVDIAPSQVGEEIKELLRLLEKLTPRVCLEIGTAKGGTLFLFTMVADPSATLLSIDLPCGPFGGGYPAWKILVLKSLAKESQTIHCIRSDSRSLSTLSDVRRILSGRKVDFLFIDGDHTYEGVKGDFEMYAPLVNEGGMIAFHDIVPHPPDKPCKVDRFWQEIKSRFNYLEIVKDWKQGWAGIGVLYV